MENIKIDAHDLDMVAFKSSAKTNAKNAILAVDTAMQMNYSILKSQLIFHLSPVIVVENDNKGGTFTLIFEGKRETVQPVPEAFALVKSISHIPLGIYSIIAPYLKSAQLKDWNAPLQSFRGVITNALNTLHQTDLTSNAVNACKNIIDLAVEFIDEAVEKGGFSIEEFQAFTRNAGDSIQTNMKIAA